MADDAGVVGGLPPLLLLVLVLDAPTRGRRGSAVLLVGVGVSLEGASSPSSGVFGGGMFWKSSHDI